MLLFCVKYMAELACAISKVINDIKSSRARKSVSFYQDRVNKVSVFKLLLSLAADID